jgi:hydroxyethylthiazole kinase-like uncharacterized protein yjeF
LVTPALLRGWSLPTPGEGKESRGHVVVIAGSSRTPGAAVLAAEASLRAGAGKLTVGTPAALASYVATVVPESLVEPLPTPDGGHLGESAGDVVRELTEKADAVLVGSGFLDADATQALMRRITPDLGPPTVVDAAATAYLHEEPGALRRLDGHAVITVNPSELAVVAGCEADDVQQAPVSAAARVARALGVVVLLGGTEKHVAAPDGRCWTYPGGSPGLGVSGSGDVQAGIVVGLLARGAEPAQAAVWAAYLHARAGERLAADQGALGHLAREQPAQIPAVLRELA